MGLSMRGSHRDSLRHRLKELYRREMFIPTSVALFINPYFFIRRGIAQAIAKNAHYMVGTMLDFGCGSKPYKELVRADSYIGADIAVSGNDNPHRDVDVFYDGKSIPFLDRCFDSVLASEVFEHVFDLDSTLVELRRVLKTGGTLLVTVPFVWEEHEVPFDFGRYSSFGILHVLEKHGFSVVHMEKTTNYVETVFQMWNAYLASLCGSDVKWLRLGLTSLLTFPFNVLGIVFSAMLPKKSHLYCNTLVVAVKRDV